jgi:hypothetical protein
VVIAGHAFVQNLRRGHYELGIDARHGLRIAAAFTELAQAIRQPSCSSTCRHILQCNRAAHGTALDVAAGPDTRRDLLATWLREKGGRSSDQAPGWAVQGEASRGSLNLIDDPGV